MPRRGTERTKPSRSSCAIASRTGVRLMPKSSPGCARRAGFLRAAVNIHADDHGLERRVGLVLEAEGGVDRLKARPRDRCDVARSNGKAMDIGRHERHSKRRRFATLAVRDLPKLWAAFRTALIAHCNTLCQTHEAWCPWPLERKNARILRRVDSHRVRRRGAKVPTKAQPALRPLASTVASEHKVRSQAGQPA